MSGAAVHFGAGNIGRGFVGLLLHRAGYQLVFTDVIDELIDALNTTHNYHVKEVGATRTSRTVWAAASLRCSGWTSVERKGVLCADGNGAELTLDKLVDLVARPRRTGP